MIEKYTNIFKELKMMSQTEIEKMIEDTTNEEHEFWKMLKIYFEKEKNFEER